MLTTIKVCVCVCVCVWMCVDVCVRFCVQDLFPSQTSLPLIGGNCQLIHQDTIKQILLILEGKSGQTAETCSIQRSAEHLPAVSV